MVGAKEISMERERANFHTDLLGIVLYYTCAVVM